jgi:hypothetical protein
MIPVSFDTDFDVDQSNKAVGYTYIEWTLTEDSGYSLYNTVDQVNNLSFDSTSKGTGRVATFTVNPTSGNTPAVGSTFVVTLGVTLKYVNTANLSLVMHSNIFTITLSIVGGENTQEVASTSTSTTAFSPATIDQPKSSLVATPAPPGLVLLPNGGSVAYPSPIVVVANANDATVNLWLDDTGSVEIRDGAEVTDTLLYVWPKSMVSATATTETPNTSSITITLHSVPVTLYNQGTIYVFLTVKFRDTEGDRRALRGLQLMENGIVDIASKVELDRFTTSNREILELRVGEVDEARDDV